MTDKEVLSLSRQLLHTYAANNRSKNPMRLHLTGCSDEVLQRIRGNNDGFDHWQLFVDSKGYMDKFPAADLVYLTSDTDNVMTTVDPNKVYIIGGIVDHNRLKNITVNRANEQGIATAQLPIGNYIEMKSRKVLAVNHVFEILVNVANNGGDWAQALEITLPSRKEFKVKGKEDQEKEDGSSSPDEAPGTPSEPMSDSTPSTSTSTSTSTTTTSTTVSTPEPLSTTTETTTTSVE